MAMPRTRQPVRWMAAWLALSGAAAVAAQPLTVNTSVNQIGRLTSAGNGQVRRFYEYDALGRPAHVEHRMDGGAYVFGFIYGYPQNGASTPGPGIVVTGETLPPDGELVTYLYDAGDLQVAISTQPGGAGTSQAIVSGITRNARGQTLSVTYGNGMVTTHTYNDTTDLRLHELATVPPGAGSAPLQDLVYGFDANGNLTSIADQVTPSLSATYTYDSLDQLSTMTAGGTPLPYQYDSTGNLIVKEGAGQTYGGTGRGPHALGTAGGVAYGYDANGNVATTSSGLQIAWNARNLPEATSNGGALVNRKWFLGEEMWKRLGGAGLTTLYMPGVRIEGGQPRKFFGTLAERSPDGSLEFYHPDHLGSSTLVTNQLQQVSYRAAYMPFGEDRITPGGTFVPRYRFNFKEPEATGFYNFGARMYNPASGRWLSPDSSASDGPNRYSYVRNNPLLYTDPTGHQSDYPPDLPKPLRAQWDEEERKWAKFWDQVVTWDAYWQRNPGPLPATEPNPPVRPEVPINTYLHDMYRLQQANRPRFMRYEKPRDESVAKIQFPIIGFVRDGEGRIYVRVELPKPFKASIAPGGEKIPGASMGSGRQPGFMVYADLDADVGLGGAHLEWSWSPLRGFKLESDPFQVSTPSAGVTFGAQFLIYDPTRKKGSQEKQDD